MRTLFFALLLCMPLQSAAQAPLIVLKFDEGQGSNTFTDSSGRGNNGNCRMSGASCPMTGVPGKLSYSALFAASCPRAFGSSVDECDYAGRAPNMNSLSPGQKTECYFSKAKMLEFARKQYSLAATCGSAVGFNPVSFTDGTVMMWYKEVGLNDGNPQQLFNPLADRAMQPSDRTIQRSPADFGWDLSLLGGR